METRRAKCVAGQKWPTLWSASGTLVTVSYLHQPIRAQQYWGLRVNHLRTICVGSNTEADARTIWGWFVSPVQWGGFEDGGLGCDQFEPTLKQVCDWCEATSRKVCDRFEATLRKVCDGFQAVFKECLRRNGETFELDLWHIEKVNMKRENVPSQNITIFNTTGIEFWSRNKYCNLIEERCKILGENDWTSLVIRSIDSLEL